MRTLFALFFAVLASMAVAAPRLVSGPMPGYVSSRTASIWMQADQPGGVQLEYWKVDNPAQRERSGPAFLRAEDDFIARIDLVKLDPGSRYEYRVLVDGGVLELGGPLYFRTQPVWRWQADPPDFRVFLASCNYLNDPPFDRPGRTYGDGYAVFETIAARARADPGYHFMLWLGDNVYFRETDYDSTWGMAYRWWTDRRVPELQPLLRATRHHAIWDDHDYGPNDSNRSFPLKGASLELFQRYWANPSYGLPETSGIFTTFSFLDADFFLLDDRWYRSADRIVGDGEKTMLGRAQLDWLKQALTASTAKFKFIANGSQMLNDVNRFEGWQNFKTEREGFVEWLTRQGIPGVVLLSGDRHHTELLKRERPGSYPLYELTCSPLTAGARDADDERDNTLRVPGTLTIGQRNFCTLDVAGPRADRRLVFRAFSTDGRELWTQEVRAESLKPATK
jgi:alkaline phosphatase D